MYIILFLVIIMNKITRFTGQTITIDGAVGTIYKPTMNESGFCEFVWRDGVTIKSFRISKHYIQSVGKKMFRFKEGCTPRNIDTHYLRCQSSMCDFSNGEYVNRDESLKQAGIYSCVGNDFL